MEDLPKDPKIAVLPGEIRISAESNIGGA